MSGLSLLFKCENLQETGSFKLRGAVNAVEALANAGTLGGVVTASSGNFGQALAYAARQRGIAARVVMPSDAARAKRDGVEAYEGGVILCEPTLEDRAAVLARVQGEDSATFISSHDHADVIAGQATVGLEILEAFPAIDAIVAPVGGGGLLSGIAIAASALAPSVQVIGAEPKGADDTARSKAAGSRVREENPNTIAKGLLVGVGELTWPIIRDCVCSVVTVSDAEIVRAMRLVWERMKLVVEPSGAVSVAAVLSPRFSKVSSAKRVAVVLSGGNVDLDRLPWSSGTHSCVRRPDAR